MDRLSSHVRKQFPGPAALGREQTRELSIETIYRQRGNAVVEGDAVLRPKRGEVTPRTRDGFRQMGYDEAASLLEKQGHGLDSETRFYRLEEGDGYFATFAEDTRIPDGHVGIIQPREPLLTAGAGLDATFVGPEEPQTGARITLEHRTVLVAADSVIAELLVVDPGTTR